jgi:hypothetical protein
MNDEEKIIFEQVVDMIKIPKPDIAAKQKIMQMVYFLIIVKELAVFNLSIPSILLDDNIID